MMKRLYIIAGCNGAGKTTASYTVLPEILNCKEFVNADEIAKGLSPFQPEKANIEAGRLMLTRINRLLESEEDFAFETTLSTKSYVKFVDKAKLLGYQVTCVFFWLDSPSLVISRVKTRVTEGGHNIPEDVVLRRYTNDLRNFFTLFISKVDNWLMIDNSGDVYQVIAEGSNDERIIHDSETWQKLSRSYDGR